MADLRDLVCTSGPLLLTDLLMLAASVLLATTVSAQLGLPGTGVGGMLRVLAPAHFISYALFGLYPGCALNVTVELRRVVLGSALAFSMYALAVASFARDTLEVVPVLLAWFLTAPALPVARWGARHLLARTEWWGRRALLVGPPSLLAEVIARSRELRWQGLRPVGMVHDLSAEGHPIASLRAPIAIVCAEEPWEWVLSQPGASRLRHVLVLVPSMMRVFGESWIEPLQVGSTAAFHVRNRLQFARYALAKRAVDIALCLLMLPFVFPVMLAIMVAIRLESPGPVLFAHRRLGRDGRWFSVWKFRTMVIDADRKLAEYLAEHPELQREWQETHKLKSDPRITRVGRFLRRSSLDELPQIWSVLTGRMSLVGPRPIVADEVVKYGDAYALYTSVPPGITGLWQVSGRNNTTYPQRVALDAAYVRNWSIWLDLYVLYRTVKTVLRREGAC
ncbi:MAG: undecaprenyl-phosphate galactose phosphotransferase WbaP [Planctomycetes bacterium]|nr:undecaprenyl-phosphate galactose phosphotransferase WbaP [Planctomycetota bacterium]